MGEWLWLVVLGCVLCCAVLTAWNISHPPSTYTILPPVGGGAVHPAPKRRSIREVVKNLDSRTKDGDGLVVVRRSVVVAG